MSGCSGLVDRTIGVFCPSRLRIKLPMNKIQKTPLELYENSRKLEIGVLVTPLFGLFIRLGAVRRLGAFFGDANLMKLADLPSL
jgi:hypothetical protein